MSNRLYYTDPYLREFDATITRVERDAGRALVTLDRTAFYPTTGGQPFDTGTLGGFPVVDVVDDESGSVTHAIELSGSDLSVGQAVHGTIDWPRRFDHMQQHTGQHVLSAAFERVLGAPTLSSTLGAEKSVIEVRLDQIDWRALERVEQAANAVLWDDRPLVRHWTDFEGAKQFALRKPPAVEGRIRIVEIPEWDVSACGGTHTARTGEVGTVKVVRWERVRGNLRFEFLCGGRALADHAWRIEALLAPRLLPRQPESADGAAAAAVAPEADRDAWSLADLEKDHIARVLARHDGNTTAAARQLGISRTTLWRKLRRYGLKRLAT